jgi:hypothetical protein
MKANVCLYSVGSFEKDNRTLYIGQLGMAHGLEDTVYKHFIEWGEIEYCKLFSTWHGIDGLKCV